jgi:hypothetical protein
MKSIFSVWFDGYNIWTTGVKNVKLCMKVDRKLSCKFGMNIILILTINLVKLQNFKFISDK